MTTQPTTRHLLIRWTTLKGLISTVVFLAVATLAEYLVVLYAISLGVKDEGILKITWPLTITVSPLFHIVPTAVIITLLFTWVYLTKKLSARPSPVTGTQGASGVTRQEMRRPMPKTNQTARTPAEETKPSPTENRGLSYLWHKVRFARMTIKSALFVFAAFLMLVIVVSLLAFPSLIYQIVTGTYQDKSPLYYFVAAIANGLRGFAEAVSPIGWIATTVNNGLIALAPGVGSAGHSLGSLIAPLANVDPPGKYLVFQNAAAWISVFSVLFYGHYGRRRMRYKKRCSKGH